MIQSNVHSLKHNEEQQLKSQIGCRIISRCLHCEFPKLLLVHSNSICAYFERKKESSNPCVETRTCTDLHGMLFSALTSAPRALLFWCASRRGATLMRPFVRAKDARWSRTRCSLLSRSARERLTGCFLRSDSRWSNILYLNTKVRHERFRGLLSGAEGQGD